jgi:hypothetical protein
MLTIPRPLLSNSLLNMSLNSGGILGSGALYAVCAEAV